MGRFTWMPGLLVLLAGGGALIWALAPRGPAELDIPRLQALATESCRCARTKRDDGGKLACWAKFEDQAARHEHGEFFRPCDPIAPKGYCFGDDPKSCVVKEYSSMPEASLCSQDEARIAEAAFADAVRRKGEGDATANPDRAFVAASRALARGGGLAVPNHDGGCAG